MAYVEYEERDNVAIITLNRPERMNAMGVEVNNLLNEAVERANSDDDIRVIVLTGAGDRAFSAGADLTDMPAARGEIQRTSRDIVGTFELEKPIIAAINGHCLAGAADLAMRCDIRIASENATFGIPEARWGLHVPGARLANLIPASTAMELALTAGSIDAQRAYEVGLVSRVVPKGKVLEEALGIAEAIAGNAPIAVRQGMHEVRRILHAQLDPLEDLIRYGGKECSDSEDAKEGPRAFAEKRKPVFQGR